VQQLLNKVCPDNVSKIAKQLADIDIRDSDELKFVCGLIFNRGLHDPHYSDAISELFSGIVSVWHAVPSAICKGEVASVQDVLTQRCQVEFEDLFASCVGVDAEERKHHMLGFMLLLGNLYLRGVVSAPSIDIVLRSLLHDGVSGAPPSEVEIECACGLLRSVGAALQEYSCGVHVSWACDRFLELRQAKKADSKIDVYSKRVQFMIQDVVELRNAQWVHKEFKNVAKTLNCVKKEAFAESFSKLRGEDGILKVVAGKRPDSPIDGKMKQAHAAAKTHRPWSPAPKQIDEAVKMSHSSEAPKRIHEAVKSSPSSEAPKKIKKKIYMCKIVKAGGSCPKGDKCAFAHALEELFGYKFSLCRNFMDTGVCQFGDKCTFAHGPHELKAMSNEPVTEISSSASACEAEVSSSISTCNTEVTSSISTCNTEITSRSSTCSSETLSRSTTLAEPSEQDDPVKAKLATDHEKHIDDLGKTKGEANTLTDLPLWQAAREEGQMGEKPVTVSEEHVPVYSKLWGAISPLLLANRCSRRNPNRIVPCTTGAVVGHRRCGTI
jgi:hypothetical protein